jgi:glycine cleavage system H protein
MVALFVILTIITFLTIDHFVQRWQIARAAAVASVAEQAAPAVAGAVGSAPLVPQGIYLGGDQTWVSPGAEGAITLGVSPLAIKAIGRPDDMYLVPVGATVRKGQILLRIFRGKRLLTLRAPFDGRVAEVNVAAFEDGSLVENDPFGRGWIYRLSPKGDVELDNYAAGEEAESWLKSEIRRLRDFFANLGKGGATLAGATLQDGGMPVEGFGSQLDEKSWERFVKEFLRLKPEERA